MNFVEQAVGLIDGSAEDEAILRGFMDYLWSLEKDFKAQEDLQLFVNILLGKRGVQSELKPGSVAPNYHNTYLPAINNLHDIMIHADRRAFPHKLFRKKSPNQTQEQFDYERENYRQVTQTEFQEFCNTLNRPIKEASWTIEGLEDDDDKFQSVPFTDYLDNGLNVYGNYQTLFKQVIPTMKLKDAEALVVVRPDYPHLASITSDQGRMDSAELLRPQVVFFHCFQILAYKEREFALVLSMDKSYVMSGNKMVQEGLIYEFFNKNSYWVIRQVGEKSKREFEFIEMWQHNFAESPEFQSVPFMKLGGIPEFIGDGALIYNSPFLAAVDHLDIVAVTTNNLLLSTELTCFPTRIIEAIPCKWVDSDKPDEVFCIEGTVSYTTEDGSHARRDCHMCSGTGLVHPPNRSGAFLRKPAEETGDGKSDKSVPIEFAAPGVETLEFQSTLADKHTFLARRVLHLDTTSTRVSTNPKETATQKVIDDRARQAVAQDHVDRCFEIFQFVINWMGKIRYGYDFGRVMIKPPKTFDMTTPAEYLTAIKENQEVGVGPVVMSGLMNNYIKSLFHNSNKEMNAYRLLQEADRFMFEPNSFVDTSIVNKTILPYELVLHTSGIQLIYELDRTTETTEANKVGFFGLSFDDQKKQLIDSAKEKARQVTAYQAGTALSADERLAALRAQKEPVNVVAA